MGEAEVAGVPDSDEIAGGGESTAGAGWYAEAWRLRADGKVTPPWDSESVRVGGARYPLPRNLHESQGFNDHRGRAVPNGKGDATRR